MLDQLWEKLSDKEREERRDCFEQARRLVTAAEQAGGLDRVSKSFTNRKKKGGIRVDLEINAGRACVPDEKQAKAE